MNTDWNWQISGDQNSLKLQAFQIASRIQHYLKQHYQMIFLAQGALGSGKTWFIKQIINNLNPQEIVTSPTFNIENIYKIGNVEVIHQDYYRVGSDFRLWLELLDNLNSKESIIYYIEWPDRILELLKEFGLTSDDKTKLLVVSLSFRGTKNSHGIESNLI